MASSNSNRDPNAPRHPVDASDLLDEGVLDEDLDAIDPEEEKTVVDDAMLSRLIDMDAGMDAERKQTVEARCKIAITKGPAAGITYTLTREHTVFGRSRISDIQVSDPAFSRQHFEIVWKPKGAAAVVDLNSGNGTFVDGTRVVACELRGGETITAASSEFKVICEGMPKRYSPPQVVEYSAANPQVVQTVAPKPTKGRATVALTAHEQNAAAAPSQPPHAAPPGVAAAQPAPAQEERSGGVVWMLMIVAVLLVAVLGVLLVVVLSQTTADLPEATPSERAVTETEQPTPPEPSSTAEDALAAARAAFERSDLPAASQHVSSALAADPELDGARELQQTIALEQQAAERLSQARALRSEGDYRGALANAQAAAQAETRQRPAAEAEVQRILREVVGRGRAALAENDEAKAEELARLALSVEPSDDGARQLLAAITGEEGTAPPGDGGAEEREARAGASTPATADPPSEPAPTTAQRSEDGTEQAAQPSPTTPEPTTEDAPERAERDQRASTSTREETTARAEPAEDDGETRSRVASILDRVGSSDRDDPTTRSRGRTEPAQETSVASETTEPEPEASAPTRAASRSEPEPEPEEREQAQVEVQVVEREQPPPTRERRQLDLQREDNPLSGGGGGSEREPDLDQGWRYYRNSDFERAALHFRSEARHAEGVEAERIRAYADQLRTLSSELTAGRRALQNGELSAAVRSLQTAWQTDRRLERHFQGQIGGLLGDAYFQMAQQDFERERYSGAARNAGFALRYDSDHADTQQLVSRLEAMAREKLARARSVQGSDPGAARELCTEAAAMLPRGNSVRREAQELLGSLGE